MTSRLSFIMNSKDNSWSKTRGFATWLDYSWSNKILSLLLIYLSSQQSFFTFVFFSMDSSTSILGSFSGKSCSFLSFKYYSFILIFLTNIKLYILIHMTLILQNSSCFYFISLIKLIFFLKIKFWPLLDVL